MSIQAAKRYAKALFELADDHDTVEKLQTELHGFKELLDDEESLRLIFYSLDIQAHEKQRLFDELLKNKTSSTFINFLKVVFQKHREALFVQMIKEYDALVDKKLNRVHAKIISAIPLDETMRTDVVAALTHSLKATILLDTTVDKNILGGFQLQVEDEVLDASLRRKLVEMKSLLRRS